MRRVIIILALTLIPSTAYGMTLQIPFTPQAPYADWSQPWQDACEETTIHMVDRYYRGDRNDTVDKAVAREEILHILRLKESRHGESLDEATDIIVDVINNFLQWEAYIVDDPSIDDLKREIDAGRPVILPASGRELENQFFRGEGPNYHTVVLVGYDEDSAAFLTHEPGTYRGRNLRYAYETVMDAMHDFVPRVTETGPKRAIFTRPTITDLSASLDGDDDGLIKLSEIEEGSVLWLADSDGDGYRDGEEVENGHSPIFDITKNPTGTLLKSPDSPDVYIVRDERTLEKIPGPSFFRQAGRAWSEVRSFRRSIVERLLGIF